MITISPNERLFISGRTGSGKTTFVRFLLRSVPRYAVLDAKHTYRPPADLRDDVPIVEAFNPKLERQIIRAPWEDEPECWEDAINDVFEDGNRLLYVDEATLIVPTRAARHPLGRAIRTGRERGVGVWTGTQRPKEIPSYVFTESEHILSYRLQFKDDRDKIVQFTGDAMSSLLARVRGHDVAYYSVMDDRAILLRPRLITRAGGQNAGTGRFPSLRNDRARVDSARQNDCAVNATSPGSWARYFRRGGVNGRTAGAGANVARAG